MAAQDRPPKEQPVKDANLIALEEELASTTGLDVTVTSKNQGGVISIKYEDLDQFDAIIKKLNT